jgi:hypothetical protein
MNINMLLWWSLGRGNTVVPSRWQATRSLVSKPKIPRSQSDHLRRRGEYSRIEYRT